jgi:hypothetical protein
MDEHHRVTLAGSDTLAGSAAQMDHCVQLFATVAGKVLALECVRCSFLDVFSFLLDDLLSGLTHVAGLKPTYSHHKAQDVCALKTDTSKNVHHCSKCLLSHWYIRT